MTTISRKHLSGSGGKICDGHRAHCLTQNGYGRGEVNGALLENGTILRLPPPEAERMQSLQPGQSVAVRGASLVTPLGTVVEVRAIGSSPEQLTELDVPRPPRGGPKGRPKGK